MQLWIYILRVKIFPLRPIDLHVEQYIWQIRMAALILLTSL